MSEDERGLFEPPPDDPPTAVEGPALEPASLEPSVPESSVPEASVPEPSLPEAPAPGASSPAEPPAAAEKAAPTAAEKAAPANEGKSVAEAGSSQTQSQPIELIQRGSPEPTRPTTPTESETLYALEASEVAEATASEPVIPIELEGGGTIESRPPPMLGPSNYIGTTIDGRYRVESLLGEGGMGFVYRCRHKVLDRKVAIKILRQDVPRARVVMERFVMEAKAASGIGNAHIVDVLDFGELPDGSTYFVMEYLEGRSLAEVMDHERPIAEELIVSIARQIAEGLGAAHLASIVHRDLKPDNVFLIDRDREHDFIKILDFGIAKIGSVQSKITRAGEIFGTPHYMAPEQARGAAVDHRADIYALGVILFELITGHVPFDSETPFGVLTQHISAEPPPPSALNPRVSPGLEAIVLKCLAKKPEQRYASMALLIEELDRLGRGVAPVARRELTQRALARTLPSSIPPPLHSPGRRRLPVYAVGLLLVAGGGTAAYFGSLGPRGEAAKLAGEARLGSRAEAAGVTLAKQARTASPDRKVALVLAPIDAHVYKGHEDLGAMPVTLSVAQDQVVLVEVRRQGFYSRKLKIDGRKPRVIVRLTPIPGVKPAVPVPAAPDEPPAGDHERSEPTDEAKAAPETGSAAPGPPASAARKPAPAPAEPEPKPASAEDERAQ